MIENHIAWNVRDIELGCPDDCPRLEELLEKYEEILADWEAERESWQKNYPGKPLPDDLIEEPRFPECDGCDYKELKREEKEIWKARMLEVD